ncbi:fractalkine [Cebus imitator]|uniref:fractalkine n=1 Tax=Cebus imitator TaxID=2715852 RepID=UPI000809BA2E|nr:fractalkine [Cebus imitator]
MASISLWWLLRLATLCHLTVLLAGQHHGVRKCNITCSKMTSVRIPVTLLLRYQHNQASCGKPAIILETRKNKLFCADPKEKWVQEAKQHLDRQAAARTPNHSTFEKLIGETTPWTTPAARVMDESVVPEPEATGESRSLEPTPSSQEEQSALGTSPELPTGAAGSSGTRFPPTPKAQDGGPAGTELFRLTPVSTAASWQSSAPHQPGPTSDAPSTQAPSTQAPSSEGTPSREPVTSGSWTPKSEETIHSTMDSQRLSVLITPTPDTQEATRRQAVGLLAFLGLLFCLGVAMFAYQNLQGCPRKMAGEMVEGLRYVPRSCGSNSYVLVPV